MKHWYLLFVVLIWMLACGSVQVNGQTLIKGGIRDQSDNKPLENVNVQNIYTREGLTTQADGLFRIHVKKGELIEITKVGYQTVRVRIHSEKEPEYYHIVMNKAPIELREVDIRGKPLDYKRDSIKFRETYDVVVRKERRHEVNMQSMPLAMLSKKNRLEWAFQEMYDKWEQDKYIDFVFNEKLVSKITYLQGNELKVFMDRYRPPYQLLRTASDYEYLDYIKRCYYDFRK